MNDNVKKGRQNRFSLNRKTLYAALLSCLVFPTLFIALFYSEFRVREFYLTSALLSALSLTFGWFFLQIWEKKMKRSVNRLLQRKFEKLNEPAALSVSAQALHEKEIAHLNESQNQLKAGYEHQLSLLHSSLGKSKEEIHRLNLDMDQKLEEMRLAYLEFEDLRKEYQRIEDEFSRYRDAEQKRIEHKESLLNEYQRTIAEQRLIIEKKQRYIAKLEGKVRDLMYEIRSLLQLETATDKAFVDAPPLEESMGYSNLTPSTYDHSLLLQQLIHKAEILTGVDHLGHLGKNSPRFLDLFIEGCTLDRRPLFESFKEETEGIVFVYSQAERRFLFVTPNIKTKLGWSAEKFSKDFLSLISPNEGMWEEALVKIKTHKEYFFKLPFLNKGGLNTLMHCHLGLVTKGPFNQQVIGILF